MKDLNFNDRMNKLRLKMPWNIQLNVVDSLDNLETLSAVKKPDSG